jgi:hypothetical protein
VTYNRRDLIGHWIRKAQPTQRMCTHACCRGYRVHPKNYPVILPNPLLRKASEDDLAYHYEHAGSDKARAQVLHELDRRDRADTARHERHQEHQRRVFARRVAKQEEVDRIFNDAEAHTRGYMLNAAGREAGISERSLFTGPESRVRRYGSEELKNYFAANPRPTGAYFRGQDTTLGPQYTAPRKRYRVA